MKFVKLTVLDDWEGETWFFFLKVEGNESNLDRLEGLLLELDPDGEKLELDTCDIVDEFEVDILVKHSPVGYMPVFNKITGVMKDWTREDAVYTDCKGREVLDLGKSEIRTWFK